MLTKSPCGILLKLIYFIEKESGNYIDSKELLKLIDLIQKKDSSIFIYNIYNFGEKDSQVELDCFDYWNDLSILENSGRIKIHKSDPYINITFTGSLSADTIQIPEEIEKCFNKINFLV